MHRLSASQSSLGKANPMTDSESKDPDKLVSVYRSSNPALAEILRNALIAEGIPCEITGELQGGLTGVLNEVRLLVRAGDEDRAKKFIEEH